MMLFFVVCRVGNEVVVKWLMEEGVNVYVCDFIGKGVLYFVVWNYNIFFMQLFVFKFVKINSKDCDGNIFFYFMLFDLLLEFLVIEEFLEQKKEVDIIKGILEIMVKMKDVNIIVDFGLMICRGIEDIMVKFYEKWKLLLVFFKLGVDLNV